MTGRALTWRQRRILEFIRQTVVERGYPPSMREIGDATHLRSTSSVSWQLSQLQRAGFIRRDARLPRAIVLTDAEDSS